jgi:hypothetical protein
MVACLPSKLKTLSSNPSTAKKKKERDNEKWKWLAPTSRDRTDRSNRQASECSELRSLPWATGPCGICHTEVESFDFPSASSEGPV